MKCFIVLNGEKLKNYKIEENSFVIAADGALKYCEENNIIPNKIVGDFDSYGKVPLGAEVFPIDKDYTDGELALYEAQKLGFKEVVFLCAGGLREDHFLGNLGLMELAHKLNIRAVEETNYSTIYFLSKGETFCENVGTGVTISLIALVDSEVECSSGLKYPYNKIVERSSSYGISNLSIDAEVSITLKSGLAFVFVNKKKI